MFLPLWREPHTLHCEPVLRQGPTYNKTEYWVVVSNILHPLFFCGNDAFLLFFRWVVQPPTRPTVHLTPELPVLGKPTARRWESVECLASSSSLLDEKGFVLVFRGCRDSQEAFFSRISFLSNQYFIECNTCFSLLWISLLFLRENTQIFIGIWRGCLCGKNPCLSQSHKLDELCTLPETNGLPWKINGWKDAFFRPMFLKALFRGSVYWPRLVSYGMISSR